MIENESEIQNPNKDNGYNKFSLYDAKRQVDLEDIVTEEAIPDLGSLGARIGQIMEPRRPLRPMRKERKKITLHPPTPGFQGLN